MTSVFSNPSLTYQQQIAHLRAEGLVIKDDVVAAYRLRHVSYYRLNADRLDFEHPAGTPSPRFKLGTHFEQDTARYDSDRNLRRMAMRGTEHIEVELRGSRAYQLAHIGGGHAYLMPQTYRDKKEFRSNRSKLSKAVQYPAETYIDHYRTTMLPLSFLRCGCWPR